VTDKERYATDPEYRKRRGRNNMTSNFVSFADLKASRLMRAAILHELHCAPGDPGEPAADMLQQVARSLVQKAGQGDVSAIKEVLDRIDGKTAAPAPETDDGPSQVNVSWGEPE
jgi:hypothetical protein